MTAIEQQIDHLLAGALRGGAAGACPAPAGLDPAKVIARIDYHGVASLLAGRLDRLAAWDPAITRHLAQQALSQAMWELGHRQAIGGLLAAFAAAGIPAVLLKGTAIAYDLYAVPAARTRGDSDVLIAPGDRDKARQLLAGLGFARAAPDGGDDFELQEVWSIGSGAISTHHVDLHWQVLNSPALAGLLPGAQCLGAARPLPGFSPDALALDRVRMLLHAGVHRAQHVTSPYFVDGRQYFGGDRLIWLVDIDLLAAALGKAEWEALCGEAEAHGAAATVLEALETAQRLLGTLLPPASVERLRKAGAGAADGFLGAAQLGRSWQEYRAIPGGARKLAFLRARLLPSREFIRAKYPRLAGLPLPLLYVRRLVDLVRPRAGQGS